MKSKQLAIHPKKTGFVLAGSKANIDRIRAEIVENPIKYGDMKVDEKPVEKWLGEQMAMGGNTESILATIKNRKGRAIASIYEIKAILEDISCLLYTSPSPRDS